MKRPRILLADDHQIVIEGLKKLLEPEFEVIEIVSDGKALIAKAWELSPDVIVMDIALTSVNGLEAGRRIRRELPGIKFIYLTMNQDRDVVSEAYRIGASAYLLKHCAYSDLRTAIRKSLVNTCYIAPSINTPPADEFQKPPKGAPSHITPRQREVLRLLAEGRSMKEVAFALDVSTRTVAFHKYRMMEGLNLRTNAELIQFAVRRLIV